MLRGTVWVAAAALLTSAAGSAAASSGQIHPRHGRPFTPVLGDYEATSDGYPASFELIRYPKGTVYAQAPYGVQNLLELSPDSCPVDPTNVSSSLLAQAPAVAIVTPGGVFPAGAPYVAGRLTGPRTARAQSSFDMRSGTHRCRQTLRWVFHPARRLPVRDGTWQLTLSDGSRLQMTVAGGGRQATVPLPQLGADCNGTPSPGAVGGLLFFIPPDRHGSQTAFVSSTDRGEFTASFTSSTQMSGRFETTAPGCTPGILSFQGRRTGR